MLDGWWAEGYDGENGWALPGEEDADHAAQDQRDGAELHRLLDEEVTREFYDRDDAGIPRAWLARDARIAEDQRAANSPRRACCATTWSSIAAEPLTCAGRWTRISASAGQRSERGGMSWTLEGTYFETCSCEVICPCTASLSFGATYDRCKVVLVFHVVDGDVAGTDVSGLTSQPSRTHRR